MVDMRTCDKCGAVIELDRNSKKINIRIAKKSSMVIGVVCDRCRQWIAERVK